MNNQLQLIDMLSTQLNRPGLDVRERMMLMSQIESVKSNIQRIENDVAQMKQMLEQR
jgi:hypothetical protein